EVGAFNLKLKRLAAAGLGHEALALRDTAVGQDHVDLGDRAGVAGAARRRKLRAAPGARPRLGDVDAGGARHVRGEFALLAVADAGARGRRGQIGDARVFRRGQADPEIGTQRFGDFFVEDFADRLARDAADHFADQKTLRHRVIAGRGARL